MAVTTMKSAVSCIQMNCVQRVHRKPYVELKDSSDRPDKEVAREVGHCQYGLPVLIRREIWRRNVYGNRNSQWKLFLVHMSNI